MRIDYATRAFVSHSDGVINVQQKITVFLARFEALDRCCQLAFFDVLAHNTGPRAVEAAPPILSAALSRRYIAGATRSFSRTTSRDERREDGGHAAF
jgi:hypothetical protein